jgi:hypothetical protein
MNPTPDTPGNPLKLVTGGVSNLLQQVSAISAADFNRWQRMAEELPDGQDAQDFRPLARKTISLKSQVSCKSCESCQPIRPGPTTRGMTP